MKIDCLDIDWAYFSDEQPVNPEDGAIWRRGTERFIRVKNMWVQYGCYEERQKLEDFLKDNPQYKEKK